MACRRPAEGIIFLSVCGMELPEGAGLLIQVTVGSTAYGLAREGSDVDSLGVYAVPSCDFWRLSKPVETVVGHEPDVTLHELGKYMRLALKCNPTILELMFVPPHLIQHWTEEAAELRGIRQHFLHEDGVRNAYGGYAKQQIDRLIRRNAEGKDGFSSDTKKRTAKHARHCFRLLRQGQQLLATGTMNVEVDNPAEYWEFDHMTVDQIVAKFVAEDLVFQHVKSVLPDRPRVELVEGFLLEMRERFL